MWRLSLSLVVALCVAVPPSAEAKIKLPWRKAKAVEKAQTREVARVERDVQKLESLLATVKTTESLSAKSWKSVANEADVLAERIVANLKLATSEASALRKADQLRTHVQNMKKEVLAGDFRSSRRHAGRALSAATELDEWAG